jgi:peptidoglycan/LPS O-acetylase OafA/YrhL
MIDTIKTRPALPALTGLRFAAAASVLYAHVCGSFLGDSPIAVTGNVSNAGMTLFFVLSGFVVHYNYSNSTGTWRGRQLFLMARFARLYPLYLLFLILDPLLTQHSLAAWSDAPMLYFLTLTQSWFSVHVNGQHLAYVLLMGAWSISTEVFLYLAYLIVGRYISKIGAENCERATVLFSIFTTAAFFGIWCFSYYAEVVVHIPVDWPWVLYISPYGRIPEFLLGTLVAQCILTGATPHYGARTLLTGALCLLALPFLAFAIIPHGGAAFGAWGFAPGVGCLIYISARYQHFWFTRIMSLTPIVALGDASYSLYMGHPYVFLLFLYFKPAASISVMGSIAISLVLSLLGYRYFEVPARRLVRRMLMETTLRLNKSSAYTLE